MILKFEVQCKMEYDSDGTYSLAHLLTSASILEELLDTEKLEKEGIKPFGFEPCYTSEELEQIAFCSQQRNNVYAEEPHMQWCICRNCAKDVQIVEKVCRKTPSILSVKQFNEFDCYYTVGSVANVCLKKDVLKAAIGAW